MSLLAIDSNVVAKWVMPESDSPHARHIPTRTALAGDRCAAVDLIYPEVTNGIWKQFLRQQASADDCHGYLTSLLALDVDVYVARDLSDDALEIALRYRIAAYDSFFVALAAQLNVEGITADEPLYHRVHGDFPQIKLLGNWQ